MPQNETIASGFGFCTDSVAFGLSIQWAGPLASTEISVTCQAPLPFEARL